MKKSIYEKYADLLINYSLHMEKGEKLFVKTTFLAEPLLKELYRAVLQAGAEVEFFMDFEDQQNILLKYADNELLQKESELKRYAFENFDAFLSIQAPYNVNALKDVDSEKMKLLKKGGAGISKLYSERTGNGSMKRSLCVFPTPALAQVAGMSMSDYEDFVFSACYLYHENPVEEWLKVRKMQQGIVDHLNKCKTVRYVNKHTDITLGVEGRIWQNSDGCNNMPSGEVFTSPIENSANGHIYFDYPSVYNGNEVQGVKLEVKDGYITKWSVEQGADFFDKIMEIPGTRYFGEVAVATNYGIQRPTKHTLFDEKIGGTVHLAIGQSYLNTGGKNESSVHWDLIADMKKDGQIYADDLLIYEKGKFLI